MGLGIYSLILLISSNAIGLNEGDSRWYSGTPAYSIQSKLEYPYKESHAGLNINYTDNINNSSIEKLREVVDKEAINKLGTDKKEEQFIGGNYVTQIKTENNDKDDSILKIGEILLRYIYIGKYIDKNKENRVLVGIYDDSGSIQVLNEVEFWELSDIGNDITYSTSIIGTNPNEEWISEREYIDMLSNEILSIYSGSGGGEFIDIGIKERLASMIANEDAKRVRIKYIDYGKSSLDDTYINRVYISISMDSLDRILNKDVELKIDRNGSVIDFDILGEGSIDI